MALNNDIHFGFSGILRDYGWRDFWADVWLPLLLLLATLVSLQIFVNEPDNSLELVKNTINLTFQIGPTLVAFILAAYACLSSIFLTDSVSGLASSEKGQDLFRSINSNFAVCLFVGLASICLAIIVYLIMSFDLKISNPVGLNNLATSAEIFLIAWMLKMVFGIISDLHDCIKTILQLKQATKPPLKQTES